MSEIGYEVFFDDYQLTLVNGLRILSVNPYRPPERKLFIEDIIQSDRSKVTADFYTSKTITVKVDITVRTRELLQAALDTLLANIQGVEKQLVVPQGAGNRTYTATYSSYVISNEGGSYVELDLLFNCSDKFGYEPNQTLLLNNTSITTNYRIINLNNISGSAKTQAPIITLTIASVTNGATPTVTIGNPVTGQAVTISRTWVAGDVLVINSQSRTVQVNGTDVAFTGAFPYWINGGAVLNYTDGLTARSMTIRAVYARRYL